MPDLPADLDVPLPRDVAAYVRDVAGQLAEMARSAGLAVLAEALHHAHDVASATLDGMDARRTG